MKKGKTCSAFLSQYPHIYVYVYICRKKEQKSFCSLLGRSSLCFCRCKNITIVKQVTINIVGRCEVSQQGCKNYQHFIQKDKISPLAKAGESCSVFHGLDLTAVVTTPKMMATTVKPWAKMRPLIKSCDCLVFPWWKARRPYISAPAVAKQPGGGETKTGLMGIQRTGTKKGKDASRCLQVRSVLTEPSRPLNVSMHYMYYYCCSLNTNIVIRQKPSTMDISHLII